jgi:hypothetical protein
MRLMRGTYPACWGGADGGAIAVPATATLVTVLLAMSQNLELPFCDHASESRRRSLSLSPHAAIKMPVGIPRRFEAEGENDR